jgi:hypothetical protein
MSPDGVLVGSYRDQLLDPDRPMKVVAGSFTPLAVPAGFKGSYALDVSRGEDVIVGWGNDAVDEEQALIWINGDDQALLLWDYLTSSGIDLSSWASLSKVAAVSDDGRTLVGYGKQWEGCCLRKYGFVVRIDCGGVTHEGMGLAGSGGHIPYLTTSRPCLGETMDFALSQGLGGAIAFLINSPTPTSLPYAGGTLLVQPGSILPMPLDGPLGSPGTGQLFTSTILPFDPLLDDFDYYLQALVADPAAPAGFAMSDRLHLTFALPQ